MRDFHRHDRALSALIQFDVCLKKIFLFLVVALAVTLSIIGLHKLMSRQSFFRNKFFEANLIALRSVERALTVTHL